MSPTFIQNARNGWASQRDLWESQPFLSLALPFSRNFYKHFTILKWPIAHEEGPAWLSRNFFHAAASLARSSKELGSKNWIFISNFSAFFLMASTLAAFSLTYSFRSCTQTAVWPISIFKVCSSMALMHCTLASSSCCLFCKISINESWSGNSYSLCSASAWHRL